MVGAADGMRLSSRCPTWHPLSPTSTHTPSRRLRRLSVQVRLSHTSAGDPTHRDGRVYDRAAVCRAVRQITRELKREADGCACGWCGEIGRGKGTGRGPGLPAHPCPKIPPALSIAHPERHKP